MRLRNSLIVMSICRITLIIQDIIIFMCQIELKARASYINDLKVGPAQISINSISCCPMPCYVRDVVEQDTGEFEVDLAIVVKESCDVAKDCVAKIYTEKSSKMSLSCVGVTI
jgi:hypothetical protein